MFFMCYWCRAQRSQLVSVEVEVQPDREHAERDDAAVEVATHGVFCPGLKACCCVAFLAQLMRAKLTEAVVA